MMKTDYPNGVFNKLKLFKTNSEYNDLRFNENNPKGIYKVLVGSGEALNQSSREYKFTTTVENQQLILEACNGYYGNAGDFIIDGQKYCYIGSGYNSGETAVVGSSYKYLTSYLIEIKNPGEHTLRVTGNYNYATIYEVIDHDTANKELIENGLVLHLDCRDEILDSKIYDRVSNVEFTCKNVIHLDTRYVFNGSNSYISLDNFDLNYQEYSISFKVKVNPTDSKPKKLFSHRTNNIGALMFFMEGVFQYDAMTNAQRVKTTYKHNKEIFTHIVVTFNNATKKAKFYIAGSLYNESIINDTIVNSVNRLSLFVDSNLDIDFLAGELGAFKVYNRELSEKEVFQDCLYENSISRKVNPELIEDGLVCHLDGNSGSNEKQTDIWIDKTGNGHDIQLHGLSFNEASGWNDGKLILDGVKDWGQNIESLNCETKTIFFNRKTKYIPNLDRASLSFLPANNHDNWWTYFDSTLRSRFACYMTQHNIEFSGKDELLSNGIITLCQHTGKRYLYHNGIKQFDNCNSSDMSAYKPNVITTMQIGKHTYNSNFTQTEISDILIYDRVLTELEIEKVTRYLETKNDVPKVNKIYSFNGKNGSNLDKTNIWINDIDLETGLNLYNLKYNEISGFVYGRLRLDGESDYIESIEDYIGALSLSFKWLNSKKEISYLIDLVNGFNGRGEAFLNDLNVLQWSNLNSFYINGELQEATGTLELIPDMSYVFHFNLDDLELSNIAIAKSFDNLNVLACEIECIYIYDRAMSDKEVLDNFRVLDRAMKVEYIIKDKYLIQDGEEIKTINPTLNKINLNELPIKFIRDYIEGSSANSGSHWVEIEAFNSSGVNVARGCTCSASGATEANQSLTRLVDGDKNSANYVGIGGSNKYVQIEFNELTAIDNIKIYHYYSDGRTYYNPKTQISTNGKEWITIFEGPNYAESSAGKVHSLADKSIETIGDIVISKVGDMQDLSVELFEKYGVDKKTISYIGQARNALIADKPKLLYIGNETKAFKLKETGVPFGEFIEMKGKIDLSAAYINYVRAIDIKATIGLKDVLKFIISNDDGVTWLTFYEGAWIEILKINAVIIEQGMDLVTINSLTEVQLQEVTENTDSLKLAWYMKKHTLDNTLTVNHIDMEYSTSL